VKVDVIRGAPPGGPKAGDPPWPKPVVLFTRTLQPPPPKVIVSDPIKSPIMK
jgi:hypothetical protein